MDFNDPLLVQNSQNCNENTENENKIQIEEHIIQLGCVKKELDEEMCNYVNVDNKCKFSDFNVLKQEAVDLENLKQENMSIEIVYVEDASANISKQDDTCCNECGKEYNGYCNNCSSLTHFLNNPILCTNSDWKTKSIPIGILEIRTNSDEKGVFALKTLPKSVIFGPFEGILPVESTTGHMWKIKDRKLVNIENGNWMQYISTTGNAIFKNLDIFQFGGCLYYQTIREIHPTEELVVCYNEEEMLKSENGDDYYYIPAAGDETQRLFACTLCGLGFSLEKCLNEHKLKCVHTKCNNTKEIIECRFCNIYLEKQEYQEHHEMYCSKNHSRIHTGTTNVQRINIDEFGKVHGNDETSTSNDEDTDCPTATIKSFEKIYVDTSIVKEECTEKTQRKYATKNYGKVKEGLRSSPKFNRSLQCDICQIKFCTRGNLNVHIRNKHSGTSEKSYKCTQCSYQTNHKGNLEKHLNIHSGIKLFKCDICKKSLTTKRMLNMHLKNTHSDIIEKDYKCSECPYQTNYKQHLSLHLNTHKDVKPFQCGLCEKYFINKRVLRMHIKNKHSNMQEKDHKCPECSYQTNYRNHLIYHLSTHKDGKPFECDICKIKFRQMSYLKRHVKTQHSNVVEKDYKCTECSYQTNHSSCLKVHLNTHKDVKPYQCDFCEQSYCQKSSLNYHMKSKHSNVKEEDFKGS